MLWISRALFRCEWLPDGWYCALDRAMTWLGVFVARTTSRHIPYSVAHLWPSYEKIPRRPAVWCWLLHRHYRRWRGAATGCPHVWCTRCREMRNRTRRLFSAGYRKFWVGLLGYRYRSDGETLYRPVKTNG